jgi:hypothetical protein
MAFNYTSKFFQLTSYLLMEYRYADQPNPETYFTNTGTNTVGYDKLVNGFMSNSIQIFNPVADSTITNNTTITSVVKISETSYVTLDPNLIVPFNDFADELTNTTNLPITFPSNLSVVYDSVRYHIRAGYNLNNIDGIIATIDFPDQNGKYVTMSQVLIRKGTNQEYEFSPSPISIGSAIYDKYLEIKIPNLKDMNDKYLVASDFFKPSTLAGLISQSGKGFIYGAPLRVSLNEVQNINTYSGYERYNTATLALLSLEQEDPFSNIGATIKESDQGQFFEYFATDNEGFIEDFILFQNSIGNSYFISHQIQIIEQIGASFIETSRFESIQTTAYDVPNYYRPIVRNAGVAASFSLRYTMSLVNNKDQSRVIRIGTYTSSNPSEWGINISPIQLSNFPQVQKIYNRIYGQGVVQSGTKSSPVKILERTKYINNILQQNYVTTVFSNITIPNESKSTTGSTEVIALGSGKLTVTVSPFDNLYKFKFIKSGSDGSATDVDLTSFGILRISFLEEKGEKLNIKSFTDNTIANPSKGEILFKVDESNSYKILSLKDRRFFITSGTEDPDPSKSLAPQKAIAAAAKPLKTSLKQGIKGRILERSNALNAIKQVADPAKTFQANVIYWGYWKPEGEKDVVEVIAPPSNVSEAIPPVIKRPIVGAPKTPNRPSVNTLTPASLLNLGATGGTPTTQTVTDLSSLTGIALDNSVITGIKSVFDEGTGTNQNSSSQFGIFNLPSNSTGSDSSFYVTSLVDLYSKYPQITKDKFLGLYSKATNNLNSYSPTFISSIKLKVSVQLD